MDELTQLELEGAGTSGSLRSRGHCWLQFNNEMLKEPERK